MATFQKFNDFAKQLARGAHQLQATGHTLKVYLSNVAPDAAADAVKADLAEIATGNGYTGPVDVQNDLSEAGGVVTVTAVDVVITASGGSVGPFRYAVITNDTPTSPADPLVCFFDYGAPITLNDGDTFTINFGASLLAIA